MQTDESERDRMRTKEEEEGECEKKKKPKVAKKNENRNVEENIQHFCRHHTTLGRIRVRMFSVSFFIYTTQTHPDTLEILIIIQYTQYQAQTLAHSLTHSFTHNHIHACNQHTQTRTPNVSATYAIQLYVHVVCDCVRLAAASTPKPIH